MCVRKASTERRHANFVNSFETEIGRDKRATKTNRGRDEPLKYLPNFMANGKGIFDVKLKHIVSRINLSMASNLCLSDSRVWVCQFVKPH